MSFSKARILRFNELPSEAPPPGAYDPKFDSKVKSVVIEKTERFQDSKSVTSSGAECNLSVSSKGIGPAPSPKFRTPQLPKKRMVSKPANMSCPKAKTKLALGSSKELKYDIQDELADLKVECANKDKSILDYQKQIEEMKKESWKLEKEMTDLRVRQVEFEEQHKNDLASMVELQREIQESREEKHLLEVETLREQLIEIERAREAEMSAQKEIEKGIEKRFVNICEQSAMLQEEVMQIESKSQEEISRLTNDLAEVKSAKELDIQSLSEIVAEKEEELASVRSELNQLKSNSEDLRDLLSRVENDREEEIVSLKSEADTLRDKVEELSHIRAELDSKLETRQKVVLQLQSQLSTLQCEVDELRAEYERLMGESEARTKELMDRHDRELIDMRHEFIRERECLQREKQAEVAFRLELECENKERSETNAFLTEELHDVQQLYKNTNRQLMETQEMLEITSNKYTEALNNHREEIEALKNLHKLEKSKLEELNEKARLEYLKELDNITEARNHELEAVKIAAEKTIEEEKRRIQDHTEKIVENAEAVTRETLAACRAESEERVKRAIAESDAKVKEMVKDVRSAAEEEIREAAERYAVCLAHAEAEKVVLEKKLAQRDEEIVKLSVTLDELKTIIENQESFSQSLQADLDRVEAELAERKDELRALKDQIRSEAADMVARRRRFEVVMAENQASVAALSQRLYESDAEVERLQNELKTGEDSILEHRGLLSAMRNTSKILSEELYTLMEQLDENKGRFDQLEAGNLAEIEALRKLFYAEIESLKHISAKEMKRLEAECKKKDLENEELKKHFDAMAVKLNEACEFLVKLEELEDTRAIEISKLELEKEKLAQELKYRSKIAEESRPLIETKEAESKLAADEAEDRIALLTAKMEAMKAETVEVEKLRVVREQQEAKLKEEIRRRREAEEEAKKLSDNCEALRKSYQEVSDKYAEMIGHHNHKQRVKHLNQLKDKIIRLEKDVETKKHLIEQQTKTIEKLKAEDKRSFAKGKENLHSLRSPYTTPVSSPHKPLTPLRDRNE